MPNRFLDAATSCGLPGHQGGISQASAARRFRLTLEEPVQLAGIPRRRVGTVVDWLLGLPAVTT